MRKKARLFLPFLLLGFGIVLAYLLVIFSPQAPRVRPVAATPRVQVMPMEKGDVTLYVHALGTVRAKTEVTLRSRLAGQIVEITPFLEPGLLVQQGQPLVLLEEKDYLSDLRKAEAALARAKADLQVEMGQQNIARQELEHLRKIMPDSAALASSELALRAPQLAQVKAAVSSAEVDVERAATALARTRIFAPFNALVLSRAVSIGHVVSANEGLATLVGTDAYWVESGLPLNTFTEAGLFRRHEPVPVEITTSNGDVWQGILQPSYATLDATNRLARILVDVPSPLAPPEGYAPLYLGDQVNIRLAGRLLTSVVIIPRRALRDNDTVWILLPDNTLDIRPVEVIWKDSTTAYIREQAGMPDTALQHGELLITSTLAAPIQGMEIQSIGARP